MGAGIGGKGRKKRRNGTGREAVDEVSLRGCRKPFACLREQEFGGKLSCVRPRPCNHGRALRDPQTAGKHASIIYIHAYTAGQGLELGDGVRRLEALEARDWGHRGLGLILVSFEISNPWHRPRCDVVLVHVRVAHVCVVCA